MQSNPLVRALHTKGIMELLDGVPLLLMIPDKEAEEQAIFVLAAAAVMACAEDGMGATQWRTYQD